MVSDEMFRLRLQAAELAKYSAKISLLEEVKRSKEEEAESWHSKVCLRNRADARRSARHPETPFSEKLVEDVRSRQPTRR